MRHLLTILLTVTSFFTCFSQTGDTSADLLKQGASLHDKGDFERAIKIYDDIIKKDPAFYLAWYEKTLSLYASGKYQACVDLCKEILKQFPNEKENRKVYVNYGSSLDAMGKPGDAIRAYNEGVKKFPDSYLLYFNRGITEMLQKDADKATEDFKKSVSLNPMHASSHLGLAQCIRPTNKIAAAMSMSAFLILEAEGKRAEQGLATLSELLGSSNVQQKDEKNIVISLSPDALDTKSKKPDDFHFAEFMLSMMTAADMGEKKEVNVAEKLRKKLDVIAELPVEGKKSKQGFFTTFYIPFFKQMYKDSLMLTAAYVMNSSSNDAAVKTWLQGNKEKVQQFFAWLDGYAWIKEEK